MNKLVVLSFIMMLTGGLLTGCGGDSKGDSDSSVAKNVTNSESVYNCPTEVAISNCEAGTCSACTCESGACKESSISPVITSDFQAVLDAIDRDCTVTNGLVSLKVSSDNKVQSCKSENIKHITAFTCSLTDRQSSIGGNIVDISIRSAELTDNNQWSESDFKVSFDEGLVGNFSSLPQATKGNINYSCLVD